MTDSKARYARFCRKVYVPLHQQPWWLDAVCGPEGWGVALAEDPQGNILGAMPWYKTRRWGLPVIQLPPFTAYAGPWLQYPQTTDFKQVSRIAFEKKVMTALIRQLPFVFFFRQNFRPEISNWMPFYWQKFRQTTRYTYRFETIAEMQALEKDLKNTLRSDLKKAAAACDFFRDDTAWELVFELNRRSFERKNLQSPYSKAIFERLHRVLQARAQSAVFIARDKAGGKPSAGVYLVFDEKEVCLLLSGTAPEFKRQGAVYGLIREALRFAAERGLAFDFEGSMDEKVEHAFRSFGGCLRPYFQVWKMGSF